MVKRVGKYELGRSLGEGTFGKVKHAIDSETNEAVAIKILDKEKIQKQNMGNQIKKEISIMKMVKHKYIVGMIEVLASKTKIFIVLELVTGGELFDKIVAAGKLTEDHARFYFTQLIEGVEYCHKLGICHRDLKPENLLLDAHGNLKISDFGLSSLYIGDADDGASRTELLHTTCGTPNYVAPEVLSDQGYDGKKADIWSCGVILYVLLAGFLPFDESTIVALFAKIQSADFTYPSWFTPEVRSLLDQMLVADPKLRITIANIKTHPWFVGSNEFPGDSDPRQSISMTQPTEDQLEGAVQSVKRTGSKDLLEHHDHDIDDVDDHPDESKPVALNAFDLISQCGGFMLDKMFSPEIFLKSDEASMMAQKKNSFRVGGNILFGSQLNKKSNISHFTASNISPQDLSGRIYDELISLKFDFSDKRDLIIQSGIINGSLLSAKGMVGIRVQVFFISPGLNLVEISKGKGDLLEWNIIYSELVDRRIAELLNKPDGK
eukprot:gene13526-18146_t